MKRIIRYLFFLFCWSSLQSWAQAPLEDTLQTEEECKVVIRKIDLSGNRKTRPGILLREIPLAAGAGYTMPQILQAMDQAKVNLMNTALFVEVKVDFRNWFRDSLDLVVAV